MPTNNVQAIYPIASLPEHNCAPNTFRMFEKDLSVCVRATQDILKGEHITVTYTDTLWATPERRAHLYFSKHFLCVCDRCKDPTEMGSYITALRCRKKLDGSVKYKIPVANKNFGCLGMMEMALFAKVLFFQKTL
jgi:SET domain